ncbi:MAG: helix-turn-helix transcriptional regulator [Myxococcales bacterium]|nr:helix-turn-helix transcriptional regulator [Myxococcales bacterium]
MTSPQMRPPFDSTSAAGAMLMRQVREPVLVGCMLAGLGTSTAYAAPPDMVWRSRRAAPQTTAGAMVPAALPAGGAIGELRRLSGLTWDQLARMFSVSRRSLHFWASGKPMAPSNEEHLQRVLAVLRKIDRGAASANRSALLGVREDGSIPFDLLVAGKYESALSLLGPLLGPGDGRRGTPPRLSEEARAARAPRPPEELVGVLQDRIHPTSGRLLASKPIATTRRK